jgi:cell division protein FtsB
MKHQDHAVRIRQLGEENQALVEEIHRLRTDMKHMESVVRKELNLIKANEVIYRFKKKKTPDDGSGTMSPRAEHGSEKGRSEKEE